MLLNIAGGDCVDDIERLEQDAGFATVIQSLATHGMTRKERELLKSVGEKVKNAPYLLRLFLDVIWNNFITPRKKKNV